MSRLSHLNTTPAARLADRVDSRYFRYHPGVKTYERDALGLERKETGWPKGTRVRVIKAHQEVHFRMPIYPDVQGNGGEQC